ncbi:MULTISPECIES: FGGY-family carbohydrate kinase [Tessaracoccus]|uniref:FGGY-family carbohydrate kinase n=1 Tax=Tessaracoccus TaxID=72763 RepID=UPI000A71D1DD|nr:MULTISPECIES: FGGY family carbohydrate kinase [Tessaracoccus]VEP39741.1 L-fuculokinase [Tessaracoccus lapidicaptus]
MNRLVAGLDLGSTGIKILIADEHGAEVAIRQRPTPWRNGPGGTTTLVAEDLLATIQDLFHDIASLLENASASPSKVAAIAASGMGETGFLLTSDGSAAGPAYAWFDPHGQEQAAALPANLRAEFAGRTGLPWGVQVSTAKILYLRDEGITLTGKQWVNLPEFVVEALGGQRSAEYSLASRTGLLDQDTGEPWTEMLDYIGVDTEFLPQLVDAGTPLGQATAAWVPPIFSGAHLTVAGHDHLVSAVSGGAISNDRYHVSMGTAEVLLRVIESPLSFEARRRLGDALINCVRHVVPGQHVLVAGVKTGLLMRRALQMFGISDLDGRTRLDDAVMALGDSQLAEGSIEVRGARNDDGVLSLVIRSDGISPAEVFKAILDHGNDEIGLLIEAMDREVPPATSSLLTGGWASMRSVQAARSQVLPSLEVSERSQDTAYGATVFAAQLLKANRA